MRIALFAALLIAVMLNLATPDAAHAATPIGTSGLIAFGTYDPAAETAVIRLANPDGTGLRTISLQGYLEDQPAWSPDGQRIAFCSNRGGNFDIWVQSIDGSGLRQLTTNPADDCSATWSPDGTRVAFDTDRNGTFDVYAINADGSGEVRLTPGADDDYFPAWSPDGSKIAFSSNRTGNSDIFVMNADGTGATNLTNSADDEDRADWSPSGAKIAYTRWVGDQLDIFTMNANGSAQTKLTTSSAIDDTAEWSPDGSRILFASNRTGDGDIYIMNPDGSGQSRLMGTPQRDWFADWQPPICTVTGVVDGDTFDCAGGTRIDMLQIDAPELGACGGDWAKAALALIFLTPGRQVALAFDATTSAGGNALAAPIWLGNDSNDYNLSIVMVYVGLAKAATVGAGNTKYLAWANASQAWAQAAQWNMWAPGKPFTGGC